MSKVVIAVGLYWDPYKRKIVRITYADGSQGEVDITDDEELYSEIVAAMNEKRAVDWGER